MRSAAACLFPNPTGGNTAPTAPPEFTGGRKQKVNGKGGLLWTVRQEQVNQISGYLDTWDSVSFDDKRRVVDLMIATVAATSDSLNITWKI